MKIVLNIPDDIISKSKYIFLSIFILIWIGYVYFTQLPNINESIIEHWKTFLFVATIFAIYMAINLWANDVANNMWPAVWAKAISLGWAIIIAMIFETAWALIAGWDVVKTIKWWIIDPSNFNDPTQFIAIMLATLLGSALWVNIATFFKAPVSITHAILWGLIWAWITAWWLWVVDWYVMWKVWGALIIAIFMWGIIAAGIYISIRKTILKQKNKWQAARHWVPIYVSLMTLVFSIYLILKWFKHFFIDWYIKRVWLEDWIITNKAYHYWDNLFDNFINEIHKVNPDTNIETVKIVMNYSTSIFIAIVISVLIYSYMIVKFKNKKKNYFEDSKDFVNKLFNLPLIFAVALLSFAHWANDVANAIWPLAAINDIVSSTNGMAWKVWIPTWVMIIWAFSLSFWLAVFGGRLIKTVWKAITKLDQTRAYSIALSAAITVILASSLWIPVSTTQIALGWIFGIWLYRQYLKNKAGKDKQVIEMSKLKGIILSWVITFPVAGIIASITYLTIIFLSK